MTRKDKLAKLVKIYAKALGVIDDNLGVDKDHVYAGCHTIQTMSREIQTTERVMQLMGELESETSTQDAYVIGYDYNPEDEAELMKLAAESGTANA